MAYVSEKLEDLDVMSNFLFNELSSHPKYQKPFAKQLLKSLLHIEVDDIEVVAEKIVMPEDPTKRGVRLDLEITKFDENSGCAKIWDIEPHRQQEKNYPKKTRYSQLMLDKNFLKSGERDFSRLPYVCIVTITNYDPFGYDRMIYTVKKCFKEEPDMCYDDGVEIVYFNTAGTIGGDDELKNFLRYLEESTTANAVDDATKSLDTMVSDVKGKSETGGRYMTTLGEYMDRVVEDAVEDLQAELAEKDSALAEQRNALAEKDSALAKQRNALAKKDSALAKQRNALAEKDAEIARLKEELANHVQ